jgi:hypothetical protein
VLEASAFLNTTQIHTAFQSYHIHSIFFSVMRTSLTFVVLFGATTSRAFTVHAEYPSMTRSRLTTNLWDTADENAAAEAESLKEKARKLREEIGAFQRGKSSLEEAERRKIQAELDVKQAYIDQYSCVVPILKPDGTTVNEKVQFPPRYEKGASKILVLEAPLPLGVILGEHETIPGLTVVDEVGVGSNGETAGFQVGDLVRACTACRIEMEQPTWQLIVGGVGRPKTMRFIFSTDFKQFETVMDALASNRMDPDKRSVLLVVERMNER